MPRFPLRPQIAFLVAVVASACGQLPAKPEWQNGAKRVSSRDMREAAMNREWQNRRYSELVAALGRPTLIMDIPGGGSPPGFAAVFGRDAETQCINAFAFIPDRDPIIRVYHCR